VIPEIDIWRVANLMLTRYGDEALAEGAKRAEELAADADLAGVAVWLRVIDAIRQLAISRKLRRSGALHRTPFGPRASSVLRPRGHWLMIPSPGHEP